MKFTKEVVDETVQREYDRLKDRYSEVISSFNKKVRINVEVDLTFIWEDGVSCRTELLDAIDYLQQTDAESQIEKKIEEYSKEIDNKIENFCEELKEFAENNDLDEEEILDSFDY